MASCAYGMPVTLRSQKDLKTNATPRPVAELAQEDVEEAMESELEDTEVLSSDPESSDDEDVVEKRRRVKIPKAQGDFSHRHESCTHHSKTCS